MLTFVIVHKWLVLQRNAGQINQISNGYSHCGNEEEETGTFFKK